MTPARAAIILLFLGFSEPVAADTLRVASFNTELMRKGPGLLLRDLRRDEDPQITAVVAVIAAADPDVIALQGVDWDFDGLALAALADHLVQAGSRYPFTFSARPNSGLTTDLDLDGDGRTNGAADAQGFGLFTGHGGLAVLSKHPIDRDHVQDFSDLLWRDLPQALLPTHPDGRPFPSKQAQAIQRLSNTNHWVVPIELPDGKRLHLMTFQASPPVFDGDEDRNGRRNHDQLRFWRLYLDEMFGPAPSSAFVIAGGANLDPDTGEGRREAIRNLLSDPRLQDPRPTTEAGDLHTVFWPDVGRMRVDYVLPSSDWTVTGSGVVWPLSPDDQSDVSRASRHRLVWVDLALD